MKIYSIYDNPSSVFGPVFALADDVAARRYAESLCKQDGTLQHDYKNDFDLYCVGQYDFSSPLGVPLITAHKPQLVLKFSSISL